MSRRLSIRCLLSLFFLGGCALPAHRDNAGSDTVSAKNPPWVKYGGLDDHPVAKFVCVTGLAVLTLPVMAAAWILKPDDDPPSSLDRAMAEAEDARKIARMRQDRDT